jgi:polyphosphate kinase
MTRNLYYRIECAFPLYDQAVKDEINDFLDIQLKDNVKARIVDAEHNNHYKMGEKGKQFRSQMMLYEYYQNKLLRKRN